MTEQRGKRTVLSEAVGERYEDGPTAPRKEARREYVPARTQYEQDNENPKTAVAL